MIERELKIPVPGLDAARQRLIAAGAGRLHPGLREVNLLLDTAGGHLASSGEVLRVRRVGDRVVLTFKGRASFRGTVKEREEIELDVASAEHAIELFAALGYNPSLRYEKDRESWILREVRVDLDHTPMGDFVEIEGPAASIEPTTRELGLDPAAAVTGSYPDLWEDYRRRHRELELPRDMVFES